MQMKKLVLGSIVLCAVVVGCGSGVKKYEDRITAEPNADIRRENIVELMDEWGGKSDEAVKLYAMLAKTDADSTVRSAAVRGLGESRNTTAVQALAEVLDNESDEFIRRDAAMALGKVHGPEAVRALLGRLRADQDDQVRAACARSLGEYRYPGVTQALVGALLAEDFSIVYEAGGSLEKLTGESFESNQDWQNWLDKSGEVFVKE
jgi:HEAT repeat protein